MGAKNDAGGDGMRVNGKSPSEISPKIFVSHEVISPIPPRTVRLVSTARQSFLGGVNLDPRDVHLHLNFAGRSIENANELSRLAARLFCTDYEAEYEPTHMPGLALSVILESASAPEWHWGFGVIEYTFKAPRPFYHSVAETVLNGTDSIYMDPHGSVPCRPVIRHVMAAAANALVISVGANPVMRIRNPLGMQLPIGLVAEVDFTRRLLNINGLPAMTYVDYTASDWAPNIIGSTVLQISDEGQTMVRWRDEWM